MFERALEYSIRVQRLLPAFSRDNRQHREYLQRGSVPRVDLAVQTSFEVPWPRRHPTPSFRYQWAAPRSQNSHLESQRLILRHLNELRVRAARLKARLLLVGEFRQSCARLVRSFANPC